MKHWHMRRISAQVAENESEGQRLFGSAYDARQAMLKERAQQVAGDRDPWKKPRIIRPKGG